MPRTAFVLISSNIVIPMVDALCAQLEHIRANESQLAAAPGRFLLGLSSQTSACTAYGSHAKKAPLRMPSRSSTLCTKGQIYPTCLSYVQSRAVTGRMQPSLKPDFWAGSARTVACIQ
jgi:hypothetical protein